MKRKTLHTKPLRVRLVAGFVITMIVVLTCAASFVYWRVEVALDRSLNSELRQQAADLRGALLAHADPAVALASLPAGPPVDQILDQRGRILASTGRAGEPALLRPADLTTGGSGPVSYDLGNLLLNRQRRLRILLFPLPSAATSVKGVYGLTTVPLGQRDEALRELLAQLAVANLAALAIASLVGYRLARAALLPVERYRVQAERIAAGATGVRLDVSVDTDDEISRLARMLNRMLATQEAAAEAQRQFIADASHELRTPLTLLTSEVELALRRPRTIPEHEQTLRMIAGDTARMVRLADQRLGLEAAARPAETPSHLPLDMNEALLRASQRGRAHPRANGRTIATLAADPALVVRTVGHGELDLIFGNLVDNALIHGQGTVTLSAHETSGLVQLAVSDEGSDLAAEFLPHAVERFRRGGASRSTPGSGLGLALVHAVVTSAGGELRLCTAGQHQRFASALTAAPRCEHPCAGTTATVLLP
ncbi:MAG: ATP-binding protein [Mycobacteriales bacterium]